MSKILASRFNQLLIILILTVVAYSNIFQNQSLVDDRVFINPDYLSKITFINSFQGFVPGGHEGVYRPIRSLFYSLFYSIFGTNLVGWHLQALLVHLASTILVYLITIRLIRHIGQISKVSLVPFLTALFFGLHPIHTEQITGMAASLDTYGIAFFLASFYCYVSARGPAVPASLRPSSSTLRILRSTAGEAKGTLLRVTPRYLLSIVFALLAFFSNEITLTLPILLLLYELLFNKPSLKFWKSNNFKIIGTIFSGVLVYLLIRFVAIHAGARGPYLANSIYLTALTMIRVFVKYIYLLIFPFQLTNNHAVAKGIEAFVYRGYRTEGIMSQSLFSPEILFSLGILGILGGLGVYFWKKAPIVSFCIFWFFISLLPVSEIIPQGAILNERSLYIGSFGFCLLLAYLIVILNSIQDLYRFRVKPGMTKEGFAVTLTLILALGYGYRTFTRNFDWKDLVTFWSKDIKNYPSENAYAYFQRGNAYVEKNKFDLALKDYEQAGQINPHFAVAIGSSAKVYEKLGDKEKTKASYERAVLADFNFWEGWFNLGNIYFNEGKLDDAGDDYFKASRANPNFQAAKDNLGVVLDKLTQEIISFSNSKISFKYPKIWSIEKQDQNILLQNQTGSFKVKFNLEVDPPAGGSHPVGQIVNQGLAQIPNVDSARVIVWSVSSPKESLLQFFLTKGKTTIEVLVSSSDSYLMRVFDKIISSLEIK